MEDENSEEIKTRNVVCEASFDVINPFNKSGYKPLPPDLRVPLVKMYGILDNGEKCLANIHCVLPYFLLRTRSPFSEELKTHVGRIVVKCARLVNYNFIQGYPLLADVIPLELKDMYGFHEAPDHFVKVVFYDVILCHRVGLTLQKECGKNELLQPYFTHIPYLLQFFIDYSIFGMGIVRFKNVKFRTWTEKTKLVFEKIESSNLPVSSTMEVEFDVLGKDIIVQQPSGEYQCPGLEAIWGEERLRCRLSDSALLKPQKPEIGIPCFKNDREENYFKEFRKILKNLKKENSEFSQIQSSPIFSQAEIEENNPNSVEEYIESQKNRELDKAEDLESDDETDEQQEMAEMTQFFQEKNEPIVIDDEPEIIDLTNLKEKEKFIQVEPDYPPVLVHPQDRPKPPSNESYPDVPTNETWCADEAHILRFDRTITFPKESPKKQTSSQRRLSDLFKDSMKLSSVHNLSVMSIEILFMCNDEISYGESDKGFDKKFIPQADKDPVVGVFFAFYDDICNKFQNPSRTGGILIQGLNIRKNEFPEISIVMDENEIFLEFGELLKSINPDIVVGYDIERLSLGYLVKRAAFLQSSFLLEASRLIPRKNEQRSDLADLKGRISLNVWKILRREHPMRHYRMSAAVSEILNRRFPEFSQFWIEKNLHKNNPDLNSVIFRHFLRMTNLDIQLLVNLDVFIKTCQMARVYGIQFHEVLSRGSQFRVESMLLRLAKKYDFCPPSIGVEQRNSMPSPETIPLTLEPKSGLYYDPVAVLDFQSLYPSVCIAYNYCFTTILGTINEFKKIEELDPNQRIQLGALPYSPPSAEWISDLQKSNMFHISPVGGIFVKKEIQKSLLSMMLEELLETRIMVKNSMKKYNDEILNKLLDARQLALKLISNVTYGYTAANYSGRMPCPEVADAIVAKGREALENAIKLIKNNEITKTYKGSKVIYGDTDSLFIQIPGATKDEAFAIAKKIAADVTSMNPYPMKLKFEKIMMPCCLLSKKRYVGLSFESESDSEGKFDAKGIETVRRDACEFVAHCMETILKLLFEKNINGVLNYLKYKSENMEKIPLEQFVLSGDYRDHYSETAVLPMKKIAAELEAISSVHKPVYGERLEYLVADPPKSRKNVTVYSCVFRLQKFLEHPQLKVHYNYYISRKLLPALARVFQLVPIRVNLMLGNTERCQVCGIGANIFCDYCCLKKEVLLNLLAESRRQESTLKSCQTICQSCIAFNGSDRVNVPCYNVSCKVWKQRYRVQIHDLDEKFERHSLGRTVERVKFSRTVIN